MIRDEGMLPIDRARAAIDALREAYGWLRLLVVPGPYRRPGRAVDEARAEALEAQGRQARAYREWNLARGMTALAPAAAPVRLDVVDAQARIRATVVDLARRVAAAAGAVYVGGPGDPVEDVLAWLEAGGPGRPFMVSTDGEAWRSGQLDDLRDTRVLVNVATTLDGCAELARTAAGVVDEPVTPLEHRCPACRSRSLQLHHGSRAASSWTVVCVRRSCRCAGVGCSCLRRDRRPGLPHVWTRAELDGPYGLATAVARASTVARAPIRSSVVGHGRWSGRRTQAAP